jgi:hypothetical protein
MNFAVNFPGYKYAVMKREIKFKTVLGSPVSSTQLLTLQKRCWVHH